MADGLFNVQTIDRETGDERWVTVRAPDADSAREAASSETAVVGEVRPADPRVSESAATQEELDTVPIEPMGEPFEGKRCGVCGAPMGRGSHVCGLCAYDDRLGIQSSQRIRTVAEDGRRIVKCRQCGYDLSGLRTAKCPECGTENIEKPNLLAGVEEESALAAVRTPAIALVVGLVGTLAIAGGLKQADGLIAAVQMLALLFPLALVITFACLFLWIGMDSPWPITALQICGAAALFALGATVGFIPLDGNPILSGVIGFFTLWASLTYLLELDLEQGCLVAVAIFITYVFGSLIIYI